MTAESITTSAINLDVPLATVTADGVENSDTIRKPAPDILTTKKEEEAKALASQAPPEATITTPTCTYYKNKGHLPEVCHQRITDNHKLLNTIHSMTKAVADISITEKSSLMSTNQDQENQRRKAFQLLLHLQGQPRTLLQATTNQQPLIPRMIPHPNQNSHRLPPLLLLDMTIQNMHQDLRST